MNKIKPLNTPPNLKNETLQNPRPTPLPLNIYPSLTSNIPNNVLPFLLTHNIILSLFKFKTIKQSNLTFSPY